MLLACTAPGSAFSCFRFEKTFSELREKLLHFVRPCAVVNVCKWHFWHTPLLYSKWQCRKHPKTGTTAKTSSTKQAKYSLQNQHHPVQHKICVTSGTSTVGQKWLFRFSDGSRMQTLCDNNGHRIRVSAIRKLTRYPRQFQIPFLQCFTRKTGHLRTQTESNQMDLTQCNPVFDEKSEKSCQISRHPRAILHRIDVPTEWIGECKLSSAK